jgi:hypothetical protein
MKKFELTLTLKMKKRCGLEEVRVAELVAGRLAILEVQGSSLGMEDKV